MQYQFKQLFDEFPYLGTFQRWEYDRGFGIIVSRQVTGDVFAHFTGRLGGSKERQDFQGMRCLFFDGFDPKRISRPNRGYSAVQWILESEIEGDLDEYLEQRQEYLNQCNAKDLKRILKADWYQPNWEGNTRRPVSSMDDALSSRLRTLLTTDLDIKAALDFLEANKTSPYLSKGDGSASEAYRRLIRDSVLVEHSEELAKQNIDSLNHIRDRIPSEFHSEIDNHIQQAYQKNIIAIDLESNGDEIYQFGYALHDSSELLSFTKAEQSVAATELNRFAEMATDKWIVGHNIVHWDMPIIKKFLNDSANLPNRIWDTLYVSTLLTPWKRLHALTGSDHAHQADADAEAALRLCNSQLHETGVGLKTLAALDASSTLTDLLGLLAKKIAQNPERFYKQQPDWLRAILNQEDPPAGIALPEVKLRDLYWIPGVRFNWPAGYSRAEHRFLSVNLLRTYMGQEGVILSPEIKLLELILNDVVSRCVEVLVCMVPTWLRVKCKEVIESIAVDRLPMGDAQAHDEIHFVEVVTYEALSAGSDPEASTKDFYQVSPHLRAQAFLKEETRVAFDQLSNLLPKSEDHGNYHFLTPIGRDDLVEVTSKEFPKGTIGWANHHPAWKGDAKPIKIFSNSRPIHIDSFVPDKEAKEGEQDPLFIRPRWIDQQSGAKTGIEGLWPTTPNRVAYWMELMGKVHSIALPGATNNFYVLLVAEPGELSIVRDICRDLRFASKPDVPILRQLSDRGEDDSRNLGVDRLSSIPNWVEAAISLKIDLQFIVEGLPLSEWLMCLSLEDDVKDVGDSEEQGEDSEGVVEVQDSSTGFTNDHVEFCYKHFLPAWLQTHFEGLVPIVLDSRIDLTTKQLRKIGKAQDFVLAPLNEEQAESLRVYNAELGSIERKEAPEDYADYEAFLQKYWKFEGFKPKTQKPAIESICNQQGDLLVKLPTGEGKSVIFQVPALLRGMHTQRLTIVVTPLKALMRDQVMALWHKGFYTTVDYLSSDREYWETSEVYQGVLDNRVKLLYVAPERFRVGRFRDVLERRYHNDEGFEFVVIDETHCVSQWGYEFRPDYFYALEEINRLYRSSENPVRILMFSATVTKAVEEDLKALLEQYSEQPFQVEPDAYSKPIQDFISIQPESLSTGVYGRGAGEKVISRAGEIAALIREAKPDVNKSVVLIFVTRKDHAEKLAEVLREQLEGQYNIDYFHAGLPPSERMRVYESVKVSGKEGTNVLIATKAFGMGMDIPNIHWCIHLAPPSYLEDYLQEIGRTGRGPEERQAAGLENITCTILHHPEDFSKNHELVQRNKLTPPEMVELWDLMLSLSSETMSGNRILVLPQTGVAELDSNKLNLALSWLERKPTRRLSKIGFVLDMLRLTLNLPALDTKAKGSDFEAQIAKSLIKLSSLESDDSSSSPPRLQEGGVWNFLRKFAGFLLHSPNAGKETPEDPEPPLPTHVAAEVKMGALLKESQLTRLDDLYRTLFQLHSDGIITIDRSIEFKKGSYNEFGDQLIAWVQNLSSELVKKPFEGVREFQPEDLNDIMLGDTELDEESDTQKFRARVESAVRATIFLCNAADLKIREELNAENQLVFTYRLPESRIGLIKWKLRRLSELAIEVRKLVEPRIDDPINLGDFFKLMGAERSLKEIEIVLKLFSNLNIFRNVQGLFSFSHLIELHTTDPLLQPDDPEIKENDKALYETLDRVNRFAELRSYAMELFSQLPDEDIRSEFIDEYFQAESPEQLETLLGRTVGSFADTESIEGLAELLAKVRQESMQEALDILEHGPEPEQYKVCVHPWHKNMQVNAGPGAGKTHVLMARTAHLIHTQGIRPEQVLILAFNRAVVHEIKARVKALFDGLGYGAYVSRMRVRTFHAFAIEHLPDYSSKSIQEDGLDQVVEKFCEKCQYDENFARETIKGTRVILVDEFQDMNESRYQMLKSLYQTRTQRTGENSLGIMVIGDDDQDILRWNRKDNPVEAKHYFEAFRDDFAPVDLFTLRINFRSSREIVRRTQAFLNNLLQPISKRLKADVELDAKLESETGNIEDHSDPSLAHVREILTRCVAENRSAAVLVHTNYEASLLHQQLVGQFSGLRLQGQQNLRVARLRHVGEWLDECHNLLEDQGDILLTEKIIQDLNNSYERKLSSSLSVGEEVNIEFLIDSAFSEQPRCTLTQLIHFIEDLDVNDYLRMYGSTKIPKWVSVKGSDKADMVVSTIHKIKGLEYDTVIIQPSAAKFPLTNHNGGRVTALDRADEMRLYYVAMTRAKDELYFTAGPRERAWMYGRTAERRTGGVILQGSPEEVFLTWPGQDDNIQNYLRTSVKVNDAIRIQHNQRSLSLHHRSQIIGFLSRSQRERLTGNGQERAIDIHVSAIYRYPISDDTPPNFVRDLTQRCKEQEWVYTVLVRGHS